MGDQYLPMNSWAADELPREKLLTKGVAALSISELFAILLVPVSEERQLWSWPGESSLIITTT